jgi:hypothetical protein
MRASDWGRILSVLLLFLSRVDTGSRKSVVRPIETLAIALAFVLAPSTVAVAKVSSAALASCKGARSLSAVRLTKAGSACTKRSLVVIPGVAVRSRVTSVQP